MVRKASGLDPRLPSAIYACINSSMSRINAGKKAGRPRVDSEEVSARFQRPLLNALEKWAIARSLKRSEALRELITLALHAGEETMVKSPTKADEFDWNSLGKDERVVKPSQEVAVYLNGSGDVVIRQKADWPHEEEDSVIIIPYERIDVMIKRLSDLK